MTTTTTTNPVDPRFGEFVVLRAGINTSHNTWAVIKYLKWPDRECYFIWYQDNSTYETYPNGDDEYTDADGGGWIRFDGGEKQYKGSMSELEAELVAEYKSSR